MARIRSIKPSVWTDERFIDLSRDARLLFLGMISHADDAGRLVASGAALIGAIYPHDNVTVRQVEKWRDELARSGLIVTYQAGRGTYAALPKWRRHQRIQKSQPSTLPPPPSTTESATEYATDSDTESRTESTTGSLPDTEGEMEMEREVEKERETELLRRGSADAPHDAGSIVAAFVDGATTAGLSRPGPSIRGRVGKAAQRLLRDGQDPRTLDAAARRLGAGGWDDLEREVRRLEAELVTPERAARPSTTDQRVGASLRRAAELRAQEASA
jgi:hypothetical protein